MPKNVNTPENTDQEAAEAPQDALEATESTTTPPKPAPPAEQPPVDPEAEVEEKPDKVSNEAAKYRRQLRSTEAERDTLTGTVETLQKQLIDRSIPHGSNVNSEALWATGRTPAEFFNNTGGIDTDKLTAAIQDTHKTLGMRFGPEPITESGTGNRQGVSEVSWADALKKR